jgi:hypothetical protein
VFPDRRTVAVAALALLTWLCPRVDARQSGQVPARQWKRVESTAVNLRFTVPPGWQTRTGTRKDRPYIEAVSPDASMYVFAYAIRDARAALEDVLDQALDELGVELDDDPQEEEIHGLEALTGETTDTVNGREVGIFIMAASYGDTRYVAYIMTDAGHFDANAAAMNRILDSFTPLAGTGK